MLHLMMDTNQYGQLFNGVSCGSNWYEAYFEPTDNRAIIASSSWGALVDVLIIRQAF
jgi:hypothetical protein